MAGLKLASQPREDHAQYIQSWLRILKSDKRAIFSAASQAQKAADFMRERATASVLAEVA
jgi:antirestriction protein ArdC